MSAEKEPSWPAIYRPHLFEDELDELLEQKKRELRSRAGSAKPRLLSATAAAKQLERLEQPPPTSFSRLGSALKKGKPQVGQRPTFEPHGPPLFVPSAIGTSVSASGRTRSARFRNPPVEEDPRELPARVPSKPATALSPQRQRPVTVAAPTKRQDPFVDRLWRGKDRPHTSSKLALTEQSTSTTTATNTQDLPAILTAILEYRRDRARTIDKRNAQQSLDRLAGKTSTVKAHLIGDYKFEAKPPGGWQPESELPEAALEKLDIDQFIDKNFDTTTPQEWLALGRQQDPASRGTSAFSHFCISKSTDAQKKFAWAPCLVLDYDADTRKYLIEWQEGASPSLAGHKKWVRRHNLRFAVETEHQFQDLIWEAVQAKARFEAEMDKIHKIEALVNGLDVFPRWTLSRWDPHRKHVHEYGNEHLLEKLALVGKVRFYAGDDPEYKMQRRLFSFHTRVPDKLKTLILQRIPDHLLQLDMDFVQDCVMQMDRTFVFSMKKTWYEMYAERKYDKEAYNQPMAVVSMFPRYTDYEKHSAAIRQNTFLDAGAVQVTFWECLSTLRNTLGLTSFRLNRKCPEGEQLRALNQVNSDSSTLMVNFRKNSSFQTPDMLISTFYNRRFAFPMVFDEFMETATSHVNFIATMLGVEWPLAVTLVVEEWLENYFNLQKLINTILKKDIEQMSGLVELEKGGFMKRTGPRARAKEFLMQLDLALEDQLRGAILLGLRIFLKLWNFQLKYDPFRSEFLGVGMPEVTPIVLTIHLQTAQDEQGCEFVPPLPKIETDILSCFHMPCTTTTSVPRIDSIIFSGTREIRMNWQRLNKEKLKTMNTDCEKILKLRVAGEEKLRQLFQECFPGVEAIRAKYEPFLFVLKEDPRKMKEFLDPETPAAWFQTALERFQFATRQVKHVTGNVVPVPPLQVNTERVKKALYERAAATVEAIKQQLEQRLHSCCAKLKKEAAELFKSLLMDPTTAEKCEQLQKIVAGVPGFLDAYSRRMQPQTAIFDLSLSMNVPYKEEAIALYWNAFAYPARIADQLPRTQLRLDDGRKRLVEMRRINEDYFDTTLTSYIAELHAYVQVPTNDLQLTTMPGKLKLFRARIGTFQKMAQWIAKAHQVLYEEVWRDTTFEQWLVDVSALETQWQMYEEYDANSKRWLDEYYVNTDTEAVRSHLKLYTATLENLVNMYDGNTHPLSSTPPQLRENIHHLLVQIQTFAKKVAPLLELRTFVLRQRDWEDLAEVLETTAEEVVRSKLKELLKIDAGLLENAVLHFT